MTQPDELPIQLLNPEPISIAELEQALADPAANEPQVQAQGGEDDDAA